MRKCLHCGHFSRTAVDPRSCPKCGTDYHASTLAPRTQPGENVAARRAAPGSERFIDQLRRESVYPAFRAVVRWAFWAWLAVIVLTVVAAFWSGNGLAISGALIGGSLATIAAAFVREAALMVADLSDAAVRHAEVAARAHDGS